MRLILQSGAEKEIKKDPQPPLHTRLIPFECSSTRWCSNKVVPAREKPTCDHEKELSMNWKADVGICLVVCLPSQVAFFKLWPASIFFIYCQSFWNLTRPLSRSHSTLWNVLIHVIWHAGALARTLAAYSAHRSIGKVGQWLWKRGKIVVLTEYTAVCQVRRIYIPNAAMDLPLVLSAWVSSQEN